MQTEQGFRDDESMHLHLIIIIQQVDQVTLCNYIDVSYKCIYSL